MKALSSLTMWYLSQARSHIQGGAILTKEVRSLVLCNPLPVVGKELPELAGGYLEEPGCNTTNRKDS